MTARYDYGATLCGRGQLIGWMRHQAKRGQGNYRSGICKTISVIFIAGTGESARVFALLTMRLQWGLQTFNGSRCQLPAVKLENVFLTFSLLFWPLSLVLVLFLPPTLDPSSPLAFFFTTFSFCFFFSITNLNFIYYLCFIFVRSSFQIFLFAHPVHFWFLEKELLKTKAGYLKIYLFKNVIIYITYFIFYLKYF